MKYVGIFFVCIYISGCSHFEKEYIVRKLEPEICGNPKKTDEIAQWIDDGTQATIYEKLSIGTGNIWLTKYKESDGSEKVRLRAGLWLVLHKGDDFSKKAEAVYSCDQLSFEGFFIRILEVSPSGIKVGVSKQK